MKSKRKFREYVLLVIAVVAAIGLVISLKASATHSYPQPQTVAAQPDVYQLWTLTNQERVKADVAPLVLDQKLDESATAKCRDMQVQGYGHLDKQGRHGYHFITELKPNSHTISENLAEGYDTSQANINAWMASPAHKAALLSTSYTSVGFGICKAGTEQYVVQHFSD